MYPISLLGLISDIKTILANLATAGVADTSRVQLGECFHGKIPIYIDHVEFGLLDAETHAVTVFTPAASAGE